MQLAESHDWMYMYDWLAFGNSLLQDGCHNQLLKCDVTVAESFTSHTEICILYKISFTV